jgi:hypothetical protein
MGRDYSWKLFARDSRPAFEYAITVSRKDPMMDPAKIDVEPVKETGQEGAAQRLCASDWLWRPWYAKLCWATIPIYWTGAALSLSVLPLSEFYQSALAGFLNIAFFPMTALIVLGFDNIRAFLGNVPRIDDGHSEAWDGAVNQPDGGFSDPDPSFDIYDPRSGTLYVGNSTSPHNGARISVF